MNRKTLVNFLETYNYKYSESEQTISVELEFNQMVFIEFQPDDQIKITDKLANTNFLTGRFEMPFKKAIRYTGILAAISPIVIIASYYLGLVLFLVFFWSGILIITLFFMLFFLIFYHTQLENFKTRIMNLSD